MATYISRQFSPPHCSSMYWSWTLPFLIFPFLFFILFIPRTYYMYSFFRFLFLFLFSSSLPVAFLTSFSPVTNSNSPCSPLLYSVVLTLLRTLLFPLLYLPSSLSVSAPPSLYPPPNPDLQYQLYPSLYSPPPQGLTTVSLPVPSTTPRPT